MGLYRPRPAPPQGGEAPPPALKPRPASRELTPQPKPGAGRTERGCLGTPDPRTPSGRPAHPARFLLLLPPPGECLPERGAAGGDGGRRGAGYAKRRSRARTTPRRADRHSGRTRDPQPRTITRTDRGPRRTGPMHPLPAPDLPPPRAAQDSPTTARARARA